MPRYDGNTILKLYSWTISSLWRVFGAVIVLSVLLLSLSQYSNSYIFFLVTLFILFSLGYSAYKIRSSSVALDYPGIDRFFQQVPCYLSIQDKDLRIMRTNQEFRRDFGDKTGELCHLAYKGRKEVCENCPVLKTFEDGQTHSTEETVITKEGKEAKMIVYTTPVINEEGAVVGVMEMSTNITEVKELQQQIENSRQEYQDLFERVPCFISIIDKDYKIIRHNRLFENEFGHCIGRECHRIYHNRDSVCDNCEVQQTLADGKIHGGEKTVVRPNGHLTHLMVYTSPLYDESGKIRAVMEMATDITETKKLQQELTYMGRTIAAMAHRIKNMLMGLEGGIFVVNTGREDNDEALVKQGWEMIERNVKKVSSIVKDLLYCSKEREMEFKSIDPTEVVKSVYELFEGRAKKEGVTLNLEINSRLPERVFDADALHSLLTNLVTNALDACTNDSTEGKSGHFIMLRAYHDKSRGHIFEVEDNGSGIPGVVGESVFEDFFSTKGREGTGLGLLVAQKVAEQHGGTITFTSDEGRGTTFRAVFPFKSDDS